MSEELTVYQIIEKGESESFKFQCLDNEQVLDAEKGKGSTSYSKAEEGSPKMSQGTFLDLYRHKRFSLKISKARSKKTSAKDGPPGKDD